MLHTGKKQCNEEPNNCDKVQLPDESILKSIAIAAIDGGESEMTAKNLDKNDLKIRNISANQHPTIKNGVILNFYAGINGDCEIPISTLMKITDGSSSIEKQTYSTLFKDLQEPKGVCKVHKNQNGDLYTLIPRLYLSQASYLFLENLDQHTIKQNSWTPVTNSLSLDFNHCLLAVETLARFHATTYALRKQLGVKGKGKLEMLQKYSFLNQQSTLQQYSNRMSSLLAPVFEHAFELAVKLIQQENPSLAFKLQRKVIAPEAIFEKVGKLLEDEKYDNDDFYVVCHGNFLADKLLFLYDKSKQNKEPVSCRITNFDSVFFGPLGSDLALFLLTCTTLEFRYEFEEKLLALYCDAFQEQIENRLGKNSPIVEEFVENIDDFHRQVEKQYKKMMEFAFYNICVLLPRILYNSSTDKVDNNNRRSNQGRNNVCSSIKDILNESKCKTQFSTQENGCIKDSDLEKFAMDNVLLRERLAEILKQLAKCRVLL